MSDHHAPSGFAIERCVAAWQRAKHALEADEELATDEAVLAVALAGDPNMLTPEELLRRIVAAIVFAEAREAEAKTIAASLRARQQRYAARAMVLRSELLEVMLALERSSFAAPYGTASVRKGIASPVVIDEEQIPAEYFETKRVLDRHRLWDDLKQGVVVDGAVLGNAAPVLALRRGKADPEAEDAS